MKAKERLAAVAAIAAFTAGAGLFATAAVAWPSCVSTGSTASESRSDSALAVRQSGSQASMLKAHLEALLTGQSAIIRVSDYLLVVPSRTEATGSDNRFSSKTGENFHLRHHGDDPITTDIAGPQSNQTPTSSSGRCGIGASPCYRM